MKLYCYTTPSHETLFSEWFLPSVGDEYDVVAEHDHEQRCPTARCQADGWKETMFRKLQCVLRAIRENWGGVFLYADVDTQWFGRSEAALKKALGDADIAIQLDAPYGLACAGLFVCRGNERVLALFERIAERMLKEHRDEQMLFNEILLLNEMPNSRLRHLVRFWPKIFLRFFPWGLYNFLPKPNPFDVRWRYLPPTLFFGGGTFTGRHWVPGSKLFVPRNALCHHANFVYGIEDKIKQFRSVREIMDQHHCKPNV